MSSGSDIRASDFVAIQNKAETLLGTGSGSRGYGQAVQSSDVFTGNEIRKSQWDLLRYDIINIRYHQDGVLPNIVTVNSGDVVGYGASHPNTNYNTLLDQAIANRFNLAASQSVVTAIGTATYTSAWYTQASVTLTITFPTSDKARYFFNSGGKIRANLSRSGGSSTAQNNAWTNILNAVGIQSFGATDTTSPYCSFYTLTNSYQIYHRQTLSTPYSANYVKFEASSNVADNSSGTATIVYIKVTLQDTYVDPGPTPPGDSVDGTLSISFDEVRASGIMIPSGTFSIDSPSYSLSSISAS